MFDRIWFFLLFPGIPTVVALALMFHRSKLGLELCLEALKEVLRSGTEPAEIMNYARMNRVQKVMMPYLEAISAGSHRGDLP